MHLCSQRKIISCVESVNVFNVENISNPSHITYKYYQCQQIMNLGMLLYSDPYIHVLNN